MQRECDSMTEHWFDETELDSSDDEVIAPVDDLQAQDTDELGDAVPGPTDRFS